jgi:hypothetical protein
MRSSSGHALDSKQIHEQLHDDLDYFCEFIQDSDIDIFDYIDLDAEITGCDLSDSCSNYDGQVSANVGGEDGGSDDGDGGYDDKEEIMKTGLSVTEIIMISI